MPGNLVDTFEDADFGRFSWNDAQNIWEFSISIGDTAVRSSITPEDNRVDIRDQCWGDVVRRIKWLQVNEPQVRKMIAEAMFSGWNENWRDDEIDTVKSVEEFQKVIALVGIAFLEDRYAGLYYNAANLFGGHMIVCTLGDEATFVYEPQIR